MIVTRSFSVLKEITSFAKTFQTLQVNNSIVTKRIESNLLLIIVFTKRETLITSTTFSLRCQIIINACKISVTQQTRGTVILYWRRKHLRSKWYQFRKIACQLILSKRNHVLPSLEFHLIIYLAQQILILLRQ